MTTTTTTTATTTTTTSTTNEHTSPSSNTNSNSPSSSSPSSMDEQDPVDQIQPQRDDDDDDEESAQTPSELTEELNEELNEETEPNRLDQLNSPPKQVNHTNSIESIRNPLTFKLYFFSLCPNSMTMKMTMTITRKKIIEMNQIHRIHRHWKIIQVQKIRKV